MYNPNSAIVRTFSEPLILQIENAFIIFMDIEPVQVEHCWCQPTLSQIRSQNVPCSETPLDWLMRAGWERGGAVGA